MKRSRALELLAQSKPILAERYGVTQLALFGSTARDAARSDSDIDFLVFCTAVVLHRLHQFAGEIRKIAAIES